jgi:methanogenic corrinoid protein MtbC1
MDQLAQAFSALEEDRVYQIIDKCLEKSSDSLSIVNELSIGMEEVGRLFKDDEFSLQKRRHLLPGQPCLLLVGWIS